MVLPVVCYVAGSFAMLTILMKNSLLDQISSDYVRTVIAKGASRRRAIWGHAFRNALIPIATGLGPMIGLLFAGSIIIENIFEIPGMGTSAGMRSSGVTMPSSSRFSPSRRVSS